MKRLGVPVRRGLMVALLIAGVMLALPAAHTISLHASHANHVPSAPDRDCSLSTCGALVLEQVYLFALVSLVLMLIDLRPILRVHIPRPIDPPPRFACV